MSYNYEDIDHIFFLDGYNLASSISSDLNPANIHTLTSKLYEITDNLLQSFILRISKDTKAPDCKKSCDYCCNQSVFLSFREILFLQSFIIENLERDAITDISLRAKEKNKITSKLRMKDILEQKHPCPLLKNNECLVYLARPMACRIYLSMSIDSCMDFYRKPEDKFSVPRLYEFPLHAGRMLNEGVETYLSEKGLNTDSWTLEMGLEFAFENSGALTDCLFQTEKINSRKWTDNDLKELRDFELNLK